MNTLLHLGTARVKITPENPLPLAGFKERKGNYSGIRKQLYARIWYFQQNNQDGNSQSVLLVQADLIWWGSDKIAELKNKIIQLMGIDSVLLHATHTHSGPQTTALFTPSLGILYEEYLQLLEDRLLQGIIHAKENLEPVRIEKGIGSCQIGVNRRKLENGKMLMKPNIHGENDPDVTVVRFTKQDDSVKGVLFHYTCHPTTTKENQVSSEFPGAAMERIERAYGDTIMASFLQGYCGDIRPALIEKDEFIYGTSENVDELGQALAAEVMKVLERPMMSLLPNLQAIQIREVALPIAVLPKAEELVSLSSAGGVLSEWSSLLLDKPARIEQDAILELCYLSIADGLSFMGINGEPVLQYGLLIKQMSGGKALPLGYTNGMIGYIPTAKQLEEGGYESLESYYFFGLPGPFAPEAELLIRKQIIALLSD